MADVVAAGDLAHRFAVAVTAAYRLALLMVGQFGLSAELDAACFGACAALSPPCARAIGMDHSTPRTCGALRSASTTQFIANAAPFAPSPTRNRKFVDSPLEGTGFEPSVPPRKSPAKLSITAALRIEIVGEGVRRGVQLTFCDNGPRIADIKAAMTDGFTTTGRLGLGLSGIKRLSNEFSIESAPGKGTTVHPMQSQVKRTRWGLARHIRSALGDPVVFP